MDDEETKDLRLALQGELPHRQYGDGVRLEVADSCPAEMSSFLLGQFGLLRLGGDGPHVGGHGFVGEGPAAFKRGRRRGHGRGCAGLSGRGIRGCERGGGGVGRGRGRRGLGLR